MRYLEEYFNEAVSGFSGTTDMTHPDWQEAKLVLESRSSEKKEYLDSLMKDIVKMMRASKGRNQEIFDTKGDIESKNIPVNILDAIHTLEGCVRDSSFNEKKKTTSLSNLASLRSLYMHYKNRKKQYVTAFKNESENDWVIAMYLCGLWLMLSYIAAMCVHVEKPSIFNDPNVKYGNLIKDWHKSTTNQQYLSYLDQIEDVKIKTEAILFESVFAFGAAIVGLIVLIRLIVWNIYTLRTKLSDKLKVTAEFMERNVNRLKNKNIKNKDKIIAKQQGAIEGLNKAAEVLRIKLDEEKMSTPPAIKKEKTDSDDSGSSSPKNDDDDFIL